MTFLIGTSGMLVIYVAWTVAQARYEITGVKSAGYAVIALIFLYNAFYSFAWLFLVVAYPLEIANYKFRARLWALTLLSVSLSAFFNAYINPIGLENAQWRYYIYYDTWITIEVLINYFFFPETSGRTLEEIAEVLDGEKARITEHGGEKIMEASATHVEKT
ncbi:hypothetical protein BJY00DRAFT_313940 [Aspergillus carlsbadensis]|nr:hypothetical protein BJY00DRAFT_313940 [Aspergillus carlsbadensis]